MKNIEQKLSVYGRKINTKSLISPRSISSWHKKCLESLFLDKGRKIEALISLAKELKYTGPWKLTRNYGDGTTKYTCLFQ